MIYIIIHILPAINIYEKCFFCSDIPMLFICLACQNAFTKLCVHTVGAHWSPKEELTFALTISITMQGNITQSFQRIWYWTRKIIGIFLWIEGMYTKRNFKLLTTKTLKTSWWKLASLDFTLFSEINPWQFYSK